MHVILRLSARFFKIILLILIIPIAIDLIYSNNYFWNILIQTEKPNVTESKPIHNENNYLHDDPIEGFSQDNNLLRGIHMEKLNDQEEIVEKTKYEG